MATQSRFKRRSTHVVEVTGLQDSVTLVYPVDLTVTVDVLDSSGAPVAGATGITCAYVAGTTGAGTTYRGSIPKSVVYNIDYYDVRATITDTSGNGRELNLSVPAQDG